MPTISRSEFHALTNHAWPQPVTAGLLMMPMPTECGWYQEGEYLGVVTLDHVDNDFGWVVLARDDAGQYRCIDVACSYPTFQNAAAVLHGNLLARVP